MVAADPLVRAESIKGHLQLNRIHLSRRREQSLEQQVISVTPFIRSL